MLYTILRSVVWLILHVAYALLGGIRYTGRENVPRTGGVLITPNHISDADPTAIGLALPRPCYFMAKEELFQIRLIGPFIRMMHGFPVKRYSADRSALRTAEQLLKQGEAVVIFPEGKLSEDGQIQELLPGVLLIAQRACVPIVPAIIEGTDAMMPYGKVVPHHAHRRICVRFGAPVAVEELTGGEKGGDALKQGAERLRARMLTLQGHAAPEIPSEPRPVEPAGRS